MTPEKTLLYIDDNRSLHDSFCWLLEDRGLGKIQCAATGEEGLTLITLNTHIVVCDYNLGSGIDGMAVLKEIMMARPDIFRVLHSSDVGTQDDTESETFNEKAMRTCSPHILLPKPFDAEVFIDEMQGLLEKDNGTQQHE